MNTIFGLGGYLVLIIGSVWAIQILFYEDPYSSIYKTFVRLVSSLILLTCFCSIGYFYFLKCIIFLFPAKSINVGKRSVPETGVADSVPLLIPGPAIMRGTLTPPS